MKRILWRTAASALAAGLLLPHAAVGAFAQEDDEGPLPGIGELLAPRRCQAHQGTQTAQIREAWHLQRLNMEEAWRLATGRGVKVAVIDTGASTAGSLYFGNRVEAYDLIGVSEDEANKQTKVDCLHGTFVTSLLAAGRRDDGEPVHPVTNFAGIAPDVEVVAYRALATSADPEGDEPPPPAPLAPVVDAIDAAIEAEVDIINLSLTVTRNWEGFDDFEAAVHRALAQGIIVVAAAGNDGANDYGPMYPASFPGVIAVGMSTDTEAAHEASYHYSPVAVAAPGGTIVGLAPSLPEDDATTANQAFTSGSGTSYAAPIVSGVIALILEYDEAMGRERATAEQIVERLKATADPPPAAVPDRQLGWGIVHPLRALTDTRPAPVDATADTFTPAPKPPPPPEPVDSRMPVLGLGVAVGAVLLVGMGVVAAIAIPAARRRPDAG